jgi:hypothetical protein
MIDDADEEMTLEKLKESFAEFERYIHELCNTGYEQEAREAVAAIVARFVIEVAKIP